MRIVVTGATGNLGTSLLSALADEPAIDSIVGLARRVPRISLPKVVWRPADVVGEDLLGVFDGADAVVHLVWIVQPNQRRGCPPAGERGRGRAGARRGWSGGRASAGVRVCLRRLFARAR